MAFAHEPDVKECLELEKRESKKKEKSFEENIIGVENEQVLHIKTELTLYLIGEKSFVPFFLLLSLLLYSLLCLLLSS